MVDDSLFANYVAVIIAAVELAKRDSEKPMLCSYGQKEKLRHDAAEFLAALRADGPPRQIPTRRRHGSCGRHRWEMTALDPTGQERAREWQRRKRELAGHDAGRK